MHAVKVIIMKLVAKSATADSSFGLIGLISASGPATLIDLRHQGHKIEIQKHLEGV
jgi:hypothetical protein